MADVPMAEVAPAAPAPMASSGFDLRDTIARDIAGLSFTGKRTCDAAVGALPDEIVVCAPDQSRFRVKIDSSTVERFGRAQFKLNERMSITPEVEAAGLPGGIQSNRVMVRLKLKL